MRRLATASVAFSAAVFAACYLLSAASVLPFALCLGALGAVALLGKGRIFRRACIALFAAALGLIVYNVHTLHTTTPAAELHDKTLSLSGVALDYPAVYDNYCRVDVKLDGAASHLKAVLYASNRALAKVEPGQALRFTARLRKANTRYGEDYDYYNSRGVYLIANADGDIEKGEVSRSLAFFPARVRRAFASTVDEIFPPDTAPFMRAILLGDKAQLYLDTPLYTALTRAGFMHIAAVSGMHISFLAALLQLLMGRTRRSAVICIALIWCFVPVTGSTPSAVRAGFMQTALLLAPIVRRENDSITSLSFALALILLQNPHAAMSVSLQLSFGAVAGIYFLYGHINRVLLSLVSSPRLRRRLEKPVGVAACSLSVMAFTLPLGAVHFGYVSVLSPIMNILALWAASLCFCTGLVACVLGIVLAPLGAALAFASSLAARYIFIVAKLISAFPYSVVYLDNGYITAWLALCYVFFAAAMFTKLSAAKRLLYPLALSVLSLAAALALLRLDAHRAYGMATVLDVGQGQSICLMSGRASVLVDCGGVYSFRNAGETAGAYLLNRGHTHLDALVLTHLHEDHANGVERLLELVRVRYLIMPAEPNDDDALLQPLLALTEERGIEVVYVGEDMLLDADGIHLALYAPVETGDTNERCLMCLASLGDFDMLITGDAPEKAENELVYKHDIHDVEVYIVGHHGSKYSSGDALLSSIGADTAIISVGYNSYGHPTAQVLERLAFYGYNVYRTDVDGRVEIRVR